MPISIEDLAQTGDSPELAAFKRKVIETTKRWTDQHGYAGTANRALRELGLLDADRLPVIAEVTLRTKFHIKDITREDIEQGRLDEKVKSRLQDSLDLCSAEIDIDTSYVAPVYPFADDWIEVVDVNLGDLPENDDD